MSGAAALCHETTLASRARDGDQKALAELYRRHSAALLRHARRMLSDDAAAQDIVQEAFARAIANIGRTREELHFKAWIFRITTNLCLRALTRNARCRPCEAPDHNVASADEQTDPERVRRRREIGACVQDALDRLPDRYRQILLLREIEQLSYEELADVLEMSKASVKVTLHRARARFAVAFISGQMLTPEVVVEDVDHGAASTNAPDCEQLEALMVERERRALERHLEQCPRCREREKQRCARRFAVLPPLPPLVLGLGGVTALGSGAGSASATGAASAGAASGASAGATATAGVSAGATAGASVLGWVAAATSGVAAAVIVASVALGPSARSARASDAPDHAPTTTHRARTEASSPPLASTPSARLASRDIKSAVGSTRSTRAGSRLHVGPSSRSSTRRARRQRRAILGGARLASSAATPRARRRSQKRSAQRLTSATRRRRRHHQRGRRHSARRALVAQARDDEQPPSHDSKRGQLSLKARFASGTVEVRRRGGQRLMLRDGSQLRLGDTLITRGASQLTLLFPGHQWIVARGTLRLIVVPPRNALAGRISVALLAGTIRARGNRRGGVSIHHGRRRRLQTADGEMRVSLRGGRLVISSIDATIDVRGPHARRTVSAGLGLTLSGRPGFAHALLSAPTTLRPVLHRGLSAPMLSWKAVARARAYRVLIGRDADFFNVVERAEVKATRYKPRLSGMVGKFYWKIVALGAHRGAPSKVYGFRVTSGSLSAP